MRLVSDLLLQLCLKIVIMALKKTINVSLTEKVSGGPSKVFLGESWAGSQAHRTQHWPAAYCHESAPSSFLFTIYRYVE